MSGTPAGLLEAIAILTGKLNISLYVAREEVCNELIMHLAEVILGLAENNHLQC
jgi:hypothetical protein